MQTNGGERVVVATDWTNIHEEGADTPQAPTHLLDYGGLCQIIERIKHIRQDENGPICRTEEGDYDKPQPQAKPSSEEQT